MAPEKQRPGNRALLLLALLTSLLSAGSCREPAPVTIRTGLLLDGRGGQTQDALITVQGTRIIAVGPYQGSEVTHDLSRYTLLPGLIDAHVHITSYLGPRVGAGQTETPSQREAQWAANALATLRAGFTTVASMGAAADRQVREAIEAGRFPGPRILTSLDPMRDSTLSPAELRREVRRRKVQGADFIKVFASSSIRVGGAPTLTIHQLRAVCDEARKGGLRSAIHAHADASVRAAAEAGCDQVEHGGLASPEGLQLLAQRGVRFDPQCGLVIRNYLDHRAEFSGLPTFDSAGFQAMERMLPVFIQVTRMAVALPSLHTMYGTDAVAGAHGKNGEDLICRVREAGQYPIAALVTATSGNAAALGLGDQIGTVAPGYEADLIALDGNPLEEIEAVRRVVFVMRAGRVVTAPDSRLAGNRVRP